MICPLASPGDEAPAAAKREEAGKSLSPKGMLLSRQGPQAAWQVVGEKEALFTNDLLLGLPGASISNSAGTVQVQLLKDLDSPYPVMEPAIILHQDKEFDLDFTLDRGLVVLTNRKEKGPARVRLHVRNETWTLQLDEPGARFLIQLYTCWPHGVPFTKEPGPKDLPLAHLLFLVLEGEASLKHDRTQVALKAPPGPAMIQWDNVGGMDEGPQGLEKLPPWAVPPTGAALAKLDRMKSYLKRFADSLASKSINETIEEFAASKDPLDRRLAVIFMGATDDLPRLGQVMSQARDLDTWDNGVIAMRHWISRGPGQDQVLYNRLVSSGRYTPIKADTVLQLLHSYGDTELARPEVYAMLIAFLNDDNLAIRGLANWHLHRLVPAGRKIAYDPLASKEDRDRARQEWKKLIPTGKMPPKYEPEGN
jgi:hypothetical protein